MSNPEGYNQWSGPGGMYEHLDKMSNKDLRAAYHAQIGAANMEKKDGNHEQAKEHERLAEVVRQEMMGNRGMGDPKGQSSGTHNRPDIGQRTKIRQLGEDGEHHMNMTTEEFEAMTPEAKGAFLLSNPDGFNQYTGAGGKSPAEHASEAAGNASHEASKDPSKERDAMMAHVAASSAHAAEATQHTEKAIGHFSAGRQSEGLKEQAAAEKSRESANSHILMVQIHAARIPVKASAENVPPVDPPVHQSVAIDTDPVLTASTDFLDEIIDGTGAGLSDPIPVVYPGQWNGRDFTSAMIQEMASTFNPSAESAPVKIGHDGDDTQPELSQVRSVNIAPCTLTNGKKVDFCLWVRIERTPEALASQRQYKKTSIEAWPPNHPSNPTPGKWNLKGLAFLGAAAPAVPGLPPTHLSTKEGVQQMSATTENDVKVLQAKNEEVTEQLTAANNEASRLRVEKEQAEAQLAAQKKQIKHNSIMTELLPFREKLTPAQMKLLEPVAMALDSDEPTVELTAGEAKKSVRSCLIGFLQGYATHGLKDPFDVPALSGKPIKTKEQADADEENMSAEEFKAKFTAKYKADNPTRTMTQCLAAAQEATIAREKAKAIAEKAKKA